MSTLSRLVAQQQSKEPDRAGGASSPTGNKAALRMAGNLLNSGQFADQISAALGEEDGPDEDGEGGGFEDLQMALQKVIQGKSDRAKQKQQAVLQELQATISDQVCGPAANTSLLLRFPAMLSAAVCMELTAAAAAPCYNPGPYNSMYHVTLGEVAVQPWHAVQLNGATC